MLLKLQDFLLFDQSNVQREIKEIQFGKLGSFLCELTELSPEEENRHAKSCRLCSLDSMSSVRGKERGESRTGQREKTNSMQV